jgi:hypothetical protein
MNLAVDRNSFGWPCNFLGGMTASAVEKSVISTSKSRPLSNINRRHVGATRGG